MKFCEIFLDLRKENGLTQEEISKKVGFAKNTVCAWEKGRAQPNFETLIELAKIFNVTTDYLLGREDDFGNIASVRTLDVNSEDELKLLSAFRTLDAYEKESILIQVNALAREKSIIKK